MAHDVFISYAHEDRTVANAVVATLEGHGIRCWIAPRDILPGSDWGEAILDAIKESRAMVLIFSSHSNDSEQIKREVERTVHQGIAVIPFRIEDVVPSKTLEFFISTQHWLDALTPPLEEHLSHLADTITVLLTKKGARERPSQAPAAEAPTPPPEPRPPAGSPQPPPLVMGEAPFQRISSILLYALIGLVVGLALAGGAWWLWSRPAPVSKVVPAPTPAPPAPAPVPAPSPTAKLPPTEYLGSDFPRLQAKVISLRFFESGWPIAAEHERVYTGSFVQSQARNIAWEVNLAFPPAPGRFKGTVESTWYGPQGKALETLATPFSILEGKTSARIAQAFKVPGHWDLGEYRVVLKINETELARGSFQVVAKKEAKVQPKVDFLQEYEATVASLQFFEDGKKAPAVSRRFYQTRFPRRSSQYIYWQLNLDIKKPAGKPVPFTLGATWYGPDGTVIFRQSSALSLAPEAATATYLESLGYLQPGRWLPGSYRVELTIGGQAVAQGTFQVVD